LVSVVATSCLLGVSTWRMEKLVETLGITRLSKSQVSVMAKDLDDQVEAFRTLFETVVRDRSKNHPVTAPTSAGHAHQFSSYTTLLD
jgi:Transposase, Mutator family